MIVNKLRKFRINLRLKAGVVLGVGVLCVAAGCNDSDEQPLASGGAAGTLGRGGSSSAGASGRGHAAGAGHAGTVSDAGRENAAPEAGSGGDQGEGVSEAGASGAGSAGADGGEPPFDAHLSPNATPQILSITSGGHDRFYGVTYDAQGNIYAVGVTAPGIESTSDFATVVAKFSAEGELDTSFGTDGYAIRNVVVGAAGELARGIVVQPDGKIVISSSVEHSGSGADARDRDIALLRYLPSGKKDTSFGDDGVVTLDLSPGVLLANNTTYLADSVWGLEMYPDGRLVLSAGQVSGAGTDTDFAIVRLTRDGERDESFGEHGVFTLDTLAGDPPGTSNNASPRNLTILPGRQGILGAGYQPIPGAGTVPCVYRVTDSGKLDTSWGVAGVFSEAVLGEQTETYAALLQSTGKVVTTGYGRESAAEKTGIVSLRLNANGTRDASYGSAGLVKIQIAGFGDNSRKLLVLPNDHLILVGGGRSTASDVDGLVVALDADGHPETTFSDSGWKSYDLGGPADFLWAAALSPSHTRVAVVGIKGAGAASNGVDDDAVLMLMKLVH